MASNKVRTRRNQRGHVPKPVITPQTHVFEVVTLLDLAYRLLDPPSGLMDSPNRVYKVVFKEEHMVEPVDSSHPFELQDYYDHPEHYRGVFPKYVPHLTVLMNCIYWSEKYPRLVTKEQVKKLYSERIIGRLGKLDEERLRKMLVERSKPPALDAYLKSLNAISKPLSEDDFKKISAPTLIIWGSDDKLTPLEDGIKLSRLIPSSRLVVIDGAGHSPHSEAPEKFVEAVLEFSKEI